MKTRIIAAALIFAISSTFAFAADPVGHYSIAGKNPGGDGGYSGEAVVSKTGDTYNVVWTIDGKHYLGTAIGDKNFIAISYKSGDETGLALYGEKGDGWVGVWAYAGGHELGTESWTRE